MKFRSDLHAGRAGEHLAAADFMYLGHDAFHAAQGMPYDLIADVEGRLLKVQVKTTRKPELLPGRNVNKTAYRFWVNRCGKGSSGTYDITDVDIFALVALDTKQVAYISANKMPKTLFVRPDNLRGTYDDELVVARNAEILTRIQRGEDHSILAEEYGLTAAYISKIKFGRARTHISGFYMSDLTLDLAIAGMAANDNRKIGGRKPKMALSS